MTEPANVHPVYNYWLWKNALPESVIQTIENENLIEAAAFGGISENAVYHDEKIRKSKVILHGRDYWPTGIFLNYGRMANQVAGWNYDLTDIATVQFGFYEPEMHYDWHEDTFILSNSPFTRKVTVILGISDVNDYEGGELLFKGLEPLRLGRGDILSFPSLQQHKVQPVINGLRKTVSSWIEGPAFK